jgi:hypothetical protein
MTGNSIEADGTDGSGVLLRRLLRCLYISVSIQEKGIPVLSSSRNCGARNTGTSLVTRQSASSYSSREDKMHQHRLREESRKNLR